LAHVADHGSTKSLHLHDRLQRTLSRQPESVGVLSITCCSAGDGGQWPLRRSMNSNFRPTAVIEPWERRMTRPAPSADIRFASEQSSPSPKDGITTTPMPARAPSLWEMQGATVGEDEAQPQPVPEYEFDQRIAW